MEIARKLFAYTKPYWRQVVLGIILGSLVSAIMGGIAWLVKPALDIVFVDRKYQYFELIPFAVVLLFTLKGIFHFGQQYLMKSAGLSLIKDTRDKLHDHIMYLPAGYFDKESSGMMMSRVMNDVSLLEAIFSEVIRAAVIEVPKVFVLMGIALYQKWDLTLASLFLVPFLAYSAKRLGKKVKQRSLEAQNRLSHLTHKLSESITGIKVVKVFNRQEYRSEKFIKEDGNVFFHTMKAIKSKEMTKLLIDLMTGIALGVVLFYGGHQVMKGALTPGAFASIITAIYLLFSPIKQVGESYTSLQRIRAALERIEHVLNTPKEPSGTRKVEGMASGISFENVGFSYPGIDIPVLANIDLAVHNREVVAIVGPSGSGKTTLVSLIPRFYDPTQGSIKIDGVDIREFDVASLRNLMGIVSQDVILFNDTVRANIEFGRPGADFTEIKMAAEMAYADEFIDKLPDGYDTVIGERGMTLSGGQRQRLAIARAVLKNPPLLILDEATSSLDSVSESLVQKALETLMKNRTTIVIAHRLSTIKNADRIVVLEDGRIRNIGNHEELITTNDTYMKLYTVYAQSVQV